MIHMRLIILFFFFSTCPDEDMISSTSLLDHYATVPSEQNQSLIKCLSMFFRENMSFYITDFWKMRKIYEFLHVLGTHCLCLIFTEYKFPSSVVKKGFVIFLLSAPASLYCCNFEFWKGLLQTWQKFCPVTPATKEHESILTPSWQQGMGQCMQQCGAVRTRRCWALSNVFLHMYKLTCDGGGEEKNLGKISSS